MDRRPLGLDGPLVPPLWLGTWPLGGGMGAIERQTALTTIRHAMELGVTAFDTAEGYGDAEELLGEAIGPGERDRVYLATKVSFGPYTRERVRDAAEQSLRRMRTDHLDLLQLHFYPADIELAEALEALESVRAHGLTVDIGLSNFTGGQVQEALRTVRPRSIQIPLNLFDDEELGDTLVVGATAGLGVLCHSTLAKGLLAGRLTAGARFAADDERSRNPRFAPGSLERYLDAADEIGSLAASVGLSLVEFAIAWSLAQPGVSSVIAGPASPSELGQQVRGVTAALAPEVVAEASAIAARAPSIGHGTPTSSPSLPT